MMDIDALVARIALQREHQTRAVRAALRALIAEQRRGLVFADEVGCGKTYEALATAALLWAHHAQSERPIQRILIVADGALMTKWFNEIETSADTGEHAAGRRKGFQQYVAGENWAGFRQMLERVEKLEHRSDGDKRGVNENGKRQVPGGRVYIAKPRLLVAGDEDATRYVTYLRSTDWDLIIVDEAHNFTNLSTQRARAFFPDGNPQSRDLGLSARYVLALTATPFQLSTNELLHLLRIVHADATDLDALADALPRYERALESFYARRHLPPEADARRRCVEALARLRLVDACDGRRPGTPGLEPLLRRYLLRNVKDPGQRDYKLTEREADTLRGRAFGKLDDVRSLVASSPLLPLTGTDAWIYMNVRDLIDDAGDAARAAAADQQKTVRPTFVAGDLRQCLSSYEQLAGSALLGRKELPRAAALGALLERVRRERHRHPKIAAMCGVVDSILEHEIERLRANPGAVLGKVLVFNTLMKTASALKDALQETVDRRLAPFIEENLAAVGWRDLEHAREEVRGALRMELRAARHRLEAKFAREHLMIDRELLAAAGIDSKSDQRSLIDVMFQRAELHCTQPLFLLRMALAFRARGDTPTTEDVQFFVMRRVGEKLIRSIDRIVDDYLDDTPASGDAYSDENRAKAHREIARLARILAAPDYVGRFDGDSTENDREVRKENFNRPYAPVVLLVSKVGEEGIDLQAHTRYVLHYDIEWNPAKMEQREGRVDREGRETRGAVQVQFFLLKDTYEERVFHTVMQRHAWFEVLIGSKKKELGKELSKDDEADTADVEVAEEIGKLTAAERERVMLNLQP